MFFVDTKTVETIFAFNKLLYIKKLPYVSTHESNCFLYNVLFYFCRYPDFLYSRWIDSQGNLNLKGNRTFVGEINSKLRKNNIAFYNCDTSHIVK